MTRLFRGPDLAGALASVAGLALGYGGGLLALWVLGLAIRGWRGWALVLAPLVLFVGARLWAWRRVAVELDDEQLRYEGASTRDDFEVPLASIRALYTDRALEGAPLVLVLDGGGERVLSHLAPSRARALEAALVARGVEPLAGASG
ncbi:MAG: hypothetical protein KF729_27060 [Sandaracinaceae bacterium]|nr:hypothetical protein [Sandaracinaceae bacterium]